MPWEISRSSIVELLSRSCVRLAVAAHQARGDDVVFEVDHQRAFLVEQQLQEVQQVAGVQRRGICATWAGRLVGPTMVTPLPDHLVSDGQRAVAALGRSEVDDHRARLHLRTVSALSSVGALRPGSARW
jgi:hypothetical protein